MVSKKVIERNSKLGAIAFYGWIGFLLAAVFGSDLMMIVGVLVGMIVGSVGVGLKFADLLEEAK